ncbi:hypothetical protein NEFER03_0690 [Nematocida sp. LUAm3]|nr:hypothetical protein NEFER03_0690 [Nematocida sp. LUAm3]KAI5175149.1 hypothetical protein NEFER02_1110 [Nematocida sp. LUAm2]KAI5178179.1 hypothetical protein NEFER01_1357 [Nematocida sp. LUAm1]
MVKHVETPWKLILPEVSEVIYVIDDESFPYDVQTVRIRYNYNRDTVDLLEIDDPEIKKNVSLGYIRVRDKVHHKAYCTMVMEQLESILKKQPFTLPLSNALSNTEGNTEGNPSGNGTVSGMVSVIGDVRSVPVDSTAGHIKMNYYSENILLFKANSVTISFSCKRCSKLHVKQIGYHKDILRDTKSIIPCENCSIHLKIDTLFHLVTVNGPNPNNIMKLEHFGVKNITIRGVSVNSICAVCNEVSPQEPNKARKCPCGTLLLLKENENPYEEVLPGNPSQYPKKVKKEDLNSYRDQGRCQHYKKSTRIFIFPCCRAKYSCDICHDQQEDHPHLLASRMVCGICLTEAPVSKLCKNPQCNASLTGTHSAFWEGGKGSRNKATMSKKDNKKYAR